MIDILHIKKIKVKNGCDCWGRTEYDEIYEVYYNDEFVCRMTSDPMVLVEKVNNVLVTRSQLK